MSVPDSTRTHGAARCLALAFAVAMAAGCASAPAPRAVALPGRPPPPPLPFAVPDRATEAPPVAAPPHGWDFFARPGRRDRWTLRIHRWQMRQRAAAEAGVVPPFPRRPRVAAGPDVAARARAGRADGGSLASRYQGFLAGRRRALAREVLDWVQAVSEDRFVHDGPVDHWPTLPEVLASEGDDCDGLELLAYHALRQLGFREDHVFRAILHRPRTGQHHMVTLWFEDAGDPWVLDPTATITTELRRISEMGDWIPLKVFSETREYTVVGR